MYPFNYPTPQNANVAIFDGPSHTNTNRYTETWVKPPNVGMIWITAIGAGGGGGTGSGDGTFFGYAGGGGAGAIINVLMPAIFCPPSLDIQLGIGGSVTSDAQTPTSTVVSYLNVSLITADAASNGSSATGSGATANGGGGSAGSAVNSTVNEFLAPFVISLATSGASGTAGSTAQTLSTTTCMIGGAGGASDSYNGQYGNSVSSNVSAIAGRLTFAPFQTFGGNRRQFSVTLSANTARYRAPNGAGGGGGGSRQTSPICAGHQGGHGLVVIISW